MLIVDSTVLIDHLNGVEASHVSLFMEAIERRRIGIGEIILFEVLQGFRNDRDFEAVRQRLCEFELYEMVTAEAAVTAARNYRLLRRRGMTVRKSHDVFIATFCIEHGHTLLHNDRDFDPFEEHLGLSVLRDAEDDQD